MAVPLSQLFFVYLLDTILMWLSQLNSNADIPFLWRSYTRGSRFYCFRQIKNRHTAAVAFEIRRLNYLGVQAFFKYLSRWSEFSFFLNPKMYFAWNRTWWAVLRSRSRPFLTWTGRPFDAEPFLREREYYFAPIHNIWKCFFYENIVVSEPVNSISKTERSL